MNKLNLCGDCDTPRTCETNGLCSYEIEKAKNIFIDKFKDKINKTALEKAKVKLSIYELYGKICIDTQGSENELLDLFTSALIMNKDFEKLFLSAVHRRVQANINRLQTLTNGKEKTQG